MTEYVHTELLSETDQDILGELDEHDISPETVDHATHPRNFGYLKNPDGEAMLKGICEDSIMIQLSLENNTVIDAAFSVNGCGFTMACGSAVTELVRGRSVHDAMNITGKRISGFLGGLPEDHIHCADLAAGTLRAALQNAVKSA